MCYWGISLLGSLMAEWLGSCMLEYYSNQAVVGDCYYSMAAQLMAGYLLSHILPTLVLADTKDTCEQVDPYWLPLMAVT